MLLLQYSHTTTTKKRINLKSSSILRNHCSASNISLSYTVLYSHFLDIDNIHNQEKSSIASSFSPHSPTSRHCRPIGPDLVFNTHTDVSQLTEAVLCRAGQRSYMLLTAACNLLTLIKTEEEEADSRPDIWSVAGALFNASVCICIYLSVLYWSKSKILNLVFCSAATSSLDWLAGDQSERHLCPLWHPIFPFSVQPSLLHLRFCP